MATKGLFGDDAAGGIRMHGDARWVTALVLATSFVYGLLGLLSLAVLVEYEGRTIPRGVLAGMQSGSAIQIALFVLGAAAWLAWQRNTNKCLRANGREGMRFTPGWTVGWYFVPLANILMPPQMMQELWQGSDPKADKVGWKASPKSNLVWAWWISFIAGNAISRIALASAASGERSASLLIDAVGAAFVVTAGVLAVVLVRRLETRIAVIDGELPVPGGETRQPSAKALVAGAAFGAITGGMAAIGWWVLLWRIFETLDVGRGGYQILGFAAAIVFGALVGYFTMLGVGGRSLMVTVVSAVVAFVGLLKATAILSGPALPTMLVDLLTRPAVVIGFIFRTALQPWWIVLALVSAAAAAAITVLRLPIGLWRLGGEMSAGALGAEGAGTAPVEAPPD